VCVCVSTCVCPHVCVLVDVCCDCVLLFALQWAVCSILEK